MYHRTPQLRADQLVRQEYTRPLVRRRQIVQVVRTHYHCFCLFSRSVRFSSWFGHENGNKIHGYLLSMPEVLTWQIFKRVLFEFT